MDVFLCPICGNSDQRFIGHKNGKPYCRKCISFHGEAAIDFKFETQNVKLDLDYNLSREQKDLSDRVVSNFKNGIDTLLYAVCGSGKTEISYGVIGYAMSRGLHVGFALPRRDVVIELYERLKNAFPCNNIIAVYGGHNETLVGDCIVLTTHQLFRYEHYFDLLVMDEIDAFPFKGSDVLEAIFKRSLRGHCLLMSATPSEQLINDFTGQGREILCLYTRFHKHKIPVPKFEKGPYIIKYLKLIKKLAKLTRLNKPCFVFVPTISMAKSLHLFISLFVKNGDYVSSKRVGRNRIIERFKKGKLKYVVTTAVLERGVTIRNAQVLVFKADSPIYDKASLIQIAGRAGRRMDAPNGEVVFFCDKITKAMEESVREISRCNSFLQN